jgi:hypothetical protein
MINISFGRNGYWWKREDTLLVETGIDGKGKGLL